MRQYTYKIIDDSENHYVPSISLYENDEYIASFKLPCVGYSGSAEDRAKAESRFMRIYEILQSHCND